MFRKVSPEFTMMERTLSVAHDRQAKKTKRAAKGHLHHFGEKYRPNDRLYRQRRFLATVAVDVRYEI